MFSIFEEWLKSVSQRIFGGSRPSSSSNLDGREGESDRTTVMPADSGFPLGRAAEDPSQLPTRTLVDAIPIDPPAADQMIGHRVGHYRIVREIGHGGMGTVYQAVRDDDEFQIDVAIKIVSRGMDSRLVLDRFRTERQILARLEHPNIARLLDGGSTDQGLPYFVMEYIAGEPLTKYCDAHQLPVSERLHLFRKVCDAVAYAHQNLIIHRDLKPDNILVTADGVPKLLDFGIAKILETTPASGDTSQPTLTVVRMGTPAYSSPEQIQGAPVGVATDVYSLGIILYELLTGRRPYRLDSLGWEESARVICERDATRPSAVISSKSDTNAETERISRYRNTTVEGLRKRLMGDLDNILAVALRKDPARRYRSVDQFSEELQRHLEGRPVMARGDSFTYSARKFIGRHRWAVAAGIAFTVLLCAAGILTAWQAHRLSVRVDQDRKLASSFLIDIHDEIAKLPGSTPAREALLTKSVDYLNGLAQETGRDPEMRRSLAVTYERFADLLAGVAGAGFGKSAQALKTYETAKGMREALAREAPGDPKAQYDLASNYLIGSYITGRTSSIEKRMAYDRKALEISEKLIKNAPENRDYQALLAKAYTSAAYGYGVYGNWTEAKDYFRKAVPIRERIAAESPENREAQRELANIYYRIGVIEAQSGQPREALDDLQKALRIQKGMLAVNQDDEQVRSDLAGTYHFLGVSLEATGDSKAALTHFRDAISLRESALAVDVRDARTRALLAGNYAERSLSLLHSGRTQDALASILHSIELQRQLLSVDAHGVPNRLNLAEYEGRLGQVYVVMHRWRDAAQSWTYAVTLYDQLDHEGFLRAPDVRHDAEHARAEATRCLQLAK